MNRLLQKFVVGDNSPAPLSSSSSTSQRQAGSNGYGSRQLPASSGGSNNATDSTNWASTRLQEGHAATPGYQYSNQQQYYGHQQQQPLSNGGYTSYGYQQHQGHIATNSQGQHLDEIPLSSPTSGSRSSAETLFGNSHQQHLYYGETSYGYGEYTDQQQQQYAGYEQQSQQQQSQYQTAADTFFNGHQGASEMAPLSASASDKNDPFANPPPSTTSSYNGFSQQHQEPSPARSTSGSIDPFANPPPSATSSYNGFEQQYQETALPGASELFSNPPPSTSSSYNGFGQQYQETAVSGSDDLFSNPPPSASSSYNGFSHQHNEYLPASSTIPSDPFASASQSISGSNNGLNQQADSTERSVDPFASHPQSVTSSYNDFVQPYSGFDQRHNECVDEDANPFAHTASTETKADPFGGYQQHAESDTFSRQPAGDVLAASHPSSGYQVVASRSESPTQVNDFFSDEASSASDLFSSQPEADLKVPPISPAKAEPRQKASLSPRKQETVDSLPTVEPTLPALDATQNEKSKQTDPTANEEDEEIALQLQKTTLDDSVKLAEMYKQMAERLEGEKNDLLKVLADQADQFYQMQEYISSLEQEVESYRSHHSQRLQ